MSGDALAQTQPLIRIAHENDTAIQSDPSSLEVDLLAQG